MATNAHEEAAPTVQPDAKLEEALGVFLSADSVFDAEQQLLDFGASYVCGEEVDGRAPAEHELPPLKPVSSLVRAFEYGDCQGSDPCYTDQPIARHRVETSVGSPHATERLLANPEQASEDLIADHDPTLERLRRSDGQAPFDDGLPIGKRTRLGAKSPSTPEKVDDFRVTNHNELSARGLQAGSVDLCRSLVRHDIGGKEHRSTEILAREPGVRVEQLRFGRALAQFAQDQRDRDPGAANYRLPHHDFGIDLDSLVHACDQGWDARL